LPGLTIMLMRPASRTRYQVRQIPSCRDSIQSWKVDKNNNTLSSLEEWTADLDEQRWKNFVNNGKDECMLLNL